MSPPIACRPGFRADSKFLIVHADDLGLSHSVNQASFIALEQGAVTSASVLVVCPWASEVGACAREHPDVDLGIHLAITSEWASYRWGPVADRNRVRSLLDPHGYFWRDENLVAQHADAAEVELEIRAQFDLALQIGIRPTHLDMHMFALAARPDLYAALSRFAKEKNVSLIAWRSIAALWNKYPLPMSPDPLLDYLIVADGSVCLNTLDDFYRNSLKELGAGVAQMIVHLGRDDSELRAITNDCPGFGSAWREREFSFVMSPEFRRLIQEYSITLIGWRDLKRLSESG